MDTLPEEMLEEIMEYLRYSDLKSFRLVCKKFYEASITFRIVNRENFVYGLKPISLLSRGHNFDDCMNILSTTERNFYHFYFFDTEITVGFHDFVEKRAKDILSLKFEHCRISYHPMNFCKNINECTQLKSLELYNVSWPYCMHSATISLPALETMVISCIPDDMFNVFTDTNVKNLHLRVHRRHLNDVVYPTGRLKDLKGVDLSGDCTDADLMIIADNLNLTTIRIYCHYVTNQAFEYFVKKQPRLQVVELRDSMFITDESLVAIADNLKELKELIIYADSDDIEYSFDALNRIINLTPVRRLDVYGCANVSGSVTTVGDVPVSKFLRQLHMSNVHNETYVTYIAENFLSLTELKLTDSNGVTTETLQLICQNLKNLKKLILWRCVNIYTFENGVSRLTFSANLKNLEKLDLSDSGWLTDSTFERYFKLSPLRILNVGRCKGLTAKSFAAMPKNFPCLENLNIAELKVDTNILLSAVSLMKRLYKLTIRVYEPIENHLMDLLYQHSDSLQRVNVGINHDNIYFIRSLERKAFVELALRYLDADDMVSLGA